MHSRLASSKLTLVALVSIWCYTSYTMSAALNSNRPFGFEARSKAPLRPGSDSVHESRSGLGGGKESTVKITVAGRHMDLTDVLKEYATAKVEHLRHYFDNVFSAEIVFAPEKDRQYSAELI